MTITKRMMIKRGKQFNNRDEGESPVVPNKISIPTTCKKRGLTIEFFKVYRDREQFSKNGDRPSKMGTFGTYACVN